MGYKIGSLSNYLAATITLIFGVIYLAKSSFLPYHGEALSMRWNEIGQNTQYLILALMRATSGGYIANSVMIIILQYKFSSYRLSWIPLLIIIVGFIDASASVYATLIIRLHTPGHPPTLAAAFIMLLLVTGYIANRKALKKV